MAATEFFDYALIQWNKYQKERRRNEEPMVETWGEMRSIIRKRYVLASYNIDCSLNSKKLTQGNRSVEEYFKDMEITMIRAKIEENNEVTMT